MHGSLQRAVSCVTPAVLVQRLPRSHHFGEWTLDGRYVPLQASTRLEFYVLHAHAFHAHPDARAEVDAVTTGYSYQFQERNGPEIILFHWHPLPGLVPFPHIHVAGGAGSVRIDSRRHIPSGSVSLPSVVRFAIEELGVRPLRRDWERILDDGEAELAGTRPR